MRNSENELSCGTRREGKEGGVSSGLVFSLSFLLSVKGGLPSARPEGPMVGATTSVLSLILGAILKLKTGNKEVGGSLKQSKGDRPRNEKVEASFRC